MNKQPDFDPVLLEIMTNEFGAVADEMAFTMRRTARSFAGREGGDFMVGLLDRKGELIARSRYALSSWYLTMIMPWVLDKYEGKFQKGDVIVSNDPYGGGSHLNDIVLVMPIYWEDELIGFSGSALHHPDVGGRAAGGFSAASKE